MIIKNINDFKSKIKVGMQLKTTRTKFLLNEVVEQEVLLRSIHKIIKEGFSLTTLKDQKIYDAYIFYQKDMEVINNSIIRIKTFDKKHTIIFDIEFIE
jgi:hypothetical protein